MSPTLRRAWVGRKTLAPSGASRMAIPDSAGQRRLASRPVRRAPATRLRAGDSHGGLVLFRRIVRTTDDGYQARLLTDFWLQEGSAWDWFDRIVYLPKSVSTR